MEFRIRDRYSSFRDLSLNEREGHDYVVALENRPGVVAIIAPHGGTIEPTTSEITRALAGDSLSWYCFEGLKQRDHHELHITSKNFDEPKCRRMVAEHDVVVAVHGCRDRGGALTSFVGGCDTRLRDLIASHLIASGFSASTDNPAFAGIDPDNICNRTNRRMGSQLEIPQGLRDALARDGALMHKFTSAVRSAIDAYLKTR